MKTDHLKEAETKKVMSISKGFVMSPTTAGLCSSIVNKHRRVGSTGTTGDESCSTDEEDNLELDEPDCSIKDHVTSKLYGQRDKNCDDKNCDQRKNQCVQRDADCDQRNRYYEEKNKFYDHARKDNFYDRRRNFYSHDNKLYNQETKEDDLYNHRSFGCYSDIATITDKVEHQKVMQRNSSDSSVYSDLGLDKCSDDLDNNYAGKNSTGSDSGSLGCEINVKDFTSGVDGDISNPETKEDILLRLQEELRNAHQELRLRDEEVNRLSRIRRDVEAELEDLTASLFQVR